VYLGTELNNSYQLKWASIVANISVALQQSFQRQYIHILTVVDPSSTILHVFAVASPKAYGAAVCIQHGNYSSLVISKLRVAPLKQNTLSRLKLMVAAVAAHLGSFVVDSLNHTYKIYYWSDSQIVL